MAKKLLAVLLAMAMVLGLVTIASADEELTVTDIEIVQGPEDNVLIEKVRYPSPSGMKVNISFSDGSVVPYTFGDEQIYMWCETAKEGFYITFSISESKGFVNVGQMTGEDTPSVCASAEVTLDVRENPVASIEVAKSSDYTYIEEFDGGYWATRYYEEGGVQKEEEYFYYFHQNCCLTGQHRSS